MSKSKKSFKGLDSIIRGEEEIQKNDTNARAPNTSEEKRATYVVNTNANQKIKAIAALEDVKIKDVVAEAFNRFITAYEEKKGPIDIDVLNSDNENKTIL